MAPPRLVSVRQARVALRGPVRTGLRQWQARHRVPLDSRSSAPPDFVGIGAQRCGTSWWHSLIEAHPRVAALGWGAKELHFFDHAWSSLDPATLADEYTAHFRRQPDQIAGEWTPRYLYDPWAVPALLAAAPDVRLLVMLRDPVARFESGLGHALKIRGKVTADGVTSTFERGRYAAQLAQVLPLVDPAQVLVLQLEQCLRERERFLAETYAFLGLEAFTPPVDVGSRNQAKRAIEVATPLLEAARRGYLQDAAALADLVPGRIDLDLWTRLRA